MGDLQPGKNRQLQSLKREEDCREQEWSRAASWMFSLGKPFPLLWAEAEMGLILCLIPCRCGAGDSAQLDQSWGEE